MRFHLLVAVLLAGTAAPALAQRDPVERRVDQLEQQMRAVQRRVFPDGRAQFVEPEIQPAQTQPGLAGRPGGDVVSSLSARVDALEAQLRTLTNQVEEQGFRTRQVEEQFTQIRRDLQGRIERIEQQGQPAPAVTPPPAAPDRPSRPARDPEPQPAPAQPAAEEPAPAAQTAGDPAEAAYNAGFRLWNARQYADAQRALEAAAQQHPNSRWTSWMRNLAGRAYLDEGKPATAARVLLANYQENPRGERAADSLFYLGEALTRLNRRTEACRVYDELAQVYPNMRAPLRSGLPAARTAARCTN